MVKFVRYGTKMKTDTYALYGKKEAATRICKFVTLSGGYLVCYHFFGASLGAEPGKSTIDIIDIATASRHHHFPSVDAGYIMGSKCINDKYLYYIKKQNVFARTAINLYFIIRLIQ